MPKGTLQSWPWGRMRPQFQFLPVNLVAVKRCSRSPALVDLREFTVTLSLTCTSLLQSLCSPSPCSFSPGQSLPFPISTRRGKASPCRRRTGISSSAWRREGEVKGHQGKQQKTALDLKQTCAMSLCCGSKSCLTSHQADKQEFSVGYASVHNEGRYIKTEQR